MIVKPQNVHALGVGLAAAIMEAIIVGINTFIVDLPTSAEYGLLAAALAVGSRYLGKWIATWST